MSKPYTHVMTYGPIDGKQVASLHRVDDGMLVAEVTNKSVLFGQDPRMPEGQRQFIDHSSAMKFLLRIADVDANGISLERPEGKTTAAWERMNLAELEAAASIQELGKDAKVLLPSGHTRLSIAN